MNGRTLRVVRTVVFCKTTTWRTVSIIEDSEGRERVRPLRNTAPSCRFDAKDLEEGVAAIRSTGTEAGLAWTLLGVLATVFTSFAFGFEGLLGWGASLALGGTASLTLVAARNTWVPHLARLVSI